MKNAKNLSTTFVLQEISYLFNANGKKHIPDIEEICAKTKLNRSTALKFLYMWWDQYQSSEQYSDMLSFLPKIDLPQRSTNALENAIAGLQCIYKEIELNNVALNNIDYSMTPFGNNLLDSLQDIKSELYFAANQVEDLNKCKNSIESELKNALRENICLQDEIREMHVIASKKLTQLREDLNASKREALAAKHLVKTIKRKWQRRTPTLKSLFYNCASSS
ncbi:MAG: hypothetical protein H0U57_07655 [Tatlockia sp.]|nr:hypothetical protein [Tatlockia sp.]